MPAFCVGVLLGNGTILEMGTALADLGTASRLVFEMADSISASLDPSDSEVRWVNVYDGDAMMISIQVIPGVSLIR